MVKVKHAIIGFFATLGLLPALTLAQERIPRPYFVTYDHYMEEPDALEIQTSPVLGWAHGLNTFLGDWIEFEYGARKWWTTAFYLDWQHTRHEGTLFTGFRFENRFRPFLEPHRINPVLYVEYGDFNGGDKTLKEIVGFDGKEDLMVPISEARREHKHEIETKLILSSEIGDWNLSENFIGEKNLNEGRWEFGYAIGVNRPLATPTGKPCAFCRERFGAGLELYGGLGVWGDVTLRGTSHYIAPVFFWILPGETTLRVSPGWGLTDQSVKTLLRFGVSHEIDDIGRHIRKLFRKN